MSGERAADRKLDWWRVLRFPAKIVVSLVMRSFDKTRQHQSVIEGNAESSESTVG